MLATSKAFVRSRTFDSNSVFFPNFEKDKLIQYIRATNIQSKRVSFKVGTSLVSKAYETGQTILVDNVYENKDFAETNEKKAQFRSMLLVPIKTTNRTMAVLCADQDEKAFFKKGHQLFVELIANQVANEFERTSSFELLHEIEGKILDLKKSNGIKKLLKDIVFGAVRLTNTSSGVIYLFSDDTKKQIIDASMYPENDFNHSHPEPRLDNPDGITVEVIRTKEIKIISDLCKEKRVNSVTKRFYKSQIAIPLLLEGNVIGVLYLDDKKERNFSEHEISLLKTLVGQATIAIVNTRAYKELNNQKEFLKILIDTIPTPIFYIDEKTRKYKICNDEYARVVSCSSKEEIIGKTADQLHEPDKAILYNQTDIELFDNPQIPQIIAEELIIVNGWEKCYKKIKKCVFNSSGKALGLIGILWDITVEKELFQSNKILLSTVKHQYLSPLTRIKGSIDLLEMDLADCDDEIKNHITKIKRNTDELGKLFNERVDFKPKSSNLFIEVSEIICDLKERENISQSIEISCENEKKEMLIDKKLIKVIVENLISNSIKYSNTEKDIISVLITYRYNEAILTIKDQGIGIPEGANDKIFKPLFRAENVGERKGSGIGLMIVQRYVILHGGTINFLSVQNKGTIFIIKLPL